MVRRKKTGEEQPKRHFSAAFPLDEWTAFADLVDAEGATYIGALRQAVRLCADVMETIANGGRVVLIDADGSVRPIDTDVLVVETHAVRRFNATVPDADLGTASEHEYEAVEKLYDICPTPRS